MKPIAGGRTMTAREIAQALQRVEAVLRRRPEAGIHDDAPATARWMSGTRFVASHPNGQRVATDMPAELGGTGDEVTPGWLFRAGLASCAATSILMAAAAAGIELSALEVMAGSRSDTRGMLGMKDVEGVPVPGGSFDLVLKVRIAASGVDPARLRAVVGVGIRRSPIPDVVMRSTPLDVQVDVDAS
jgi:uncharacterized OsmC-like protein